jgi:hypothetical protein
MSTTTSIIVRKVSAIAEDADAMEQLRDGLASAAAGDIPSWTHWYPMNDQDAPVHPALIAWDKVVDAAVREVAPEAARLLQAAIERRLPWTYE